ncbi:hypothetical protein SULPSESMR1_04736 (plasmid) [Pseudosulfitobacter pseudonitzschiae]|uniref:Uncharacterized protein n=1 Tax=Pseudosulfitobacter pseudonitzschiae TaxID=1402135 RepID=A0A221K610_9RHOB|nr:hypothetical protein SULPSESMR1_04736 [Pseudosulfitobacter pseudonitzschiae]
MARNGTVFDVSRPFPNGYAIDDLLSGPRLVALRMTQFALTSKMITQFFAQQTACLHEKAFVDRFMRHTHAFVARIRQLEPPRNLFWGPIFTELGINEIPQHYVLIKQKWFGPLAAPQSSRFLSNIGNEPGICQTETPHDARITAIRKLQRGIDATEDRQFSIGHVSKYDHVS